MHGLNICYTFPELFQDDDEAFCGMLYLQTVFLKILVWQSFVSTITKQKSDTYRKYETRAPVLFPTRAPVNSNYDRSEREESWPPKKSEHGRDEKKTWTPHYYRWSIYSRS